MSDPNEHSIARFRFSATSHRSWHTGLSSWATGSAFLGDRLLDRGALTERLDALREPRQVSELAAVLNGSYAFVWRGPDGAVYAAVDQGRSIPLFYGIRDGVLMIADVAVEVRRHVGAGEIDLSCAIDLLMTGFVTGRDTLVPGVMQLQQGEHLIAGLAGSDWDIECGYHYQYVYDVEQTGDREQHFGKLSNAMAESCGRMVEIAAGRQILLALSGGLDSTMIAAALRRLAYKNVHCFTYGRRGTRETIHSEQVARELGFTHSNIEYTGAAWREWLRSEDRRQYWSMAHNLNALPHVQDAMAVRSLLQQNAIDRDAVVVSGQSTEAFYGLQFEPDDWKAMLSSEYDVKAIAGIAYRLHYRLWPWEPLGPDTMQQMYGRIENSMLDSGKHPIATSMFEAWVTREKMIKFNNNSVRAYEHYGLDWWLPLFDIDICNFWAAIPSQLRHNRAFTRWFVSRYYEETCGHEFDTGAGYSGYERLAKRFRPMVWMGGISAALYLALKRELQYSRDRMGWYEVIPRSLYRKLAHYRFNINSLLVLELLGALDLGLGKGLAEELEMPSELADRLDGLVRRGVRGSG